MTDIKTSLTMPRLSLQEQALFAKRLSLLTQSGVPLLRGVHMLEADAESRNLKKMFTLIAEDLANGQFLSKSLGRFRKVFGDFAINMIYVGETSGNLSQNLRYLSEEIDKQRRLRQKVVSALVYPCVILIASLAVSGLMTVYLFPKLLPIFKSLNVDLPFTTRALLFISNFLINYWYYLLGGLITLIIAFFLLLRATPFRFLMHKLVLKIPLVGTMLKYYYIVNMCRTLGITFKSQIHVLEATNITADTCTNMVYSKALRELNQSITKGGNMADYFSQDKAHFPSLMSQMISIGESTGTLSDTLLYLSNIYEEELDEQTKRLSSLIEPAVMIFMGIIVGFIAVSIITPIYEITQNLNPKH